MTRHKKHSSRLALPHQYPDLLGIPAWAFPLLQRTKLLEQKTCCRFHSFSFNLPQADLIHDGGMEDSRGGFLDHLRMRVRGEKGNDLFGGDTHADSAADGVAGNFAGDHIRVAGGEADEEL